MQSLKSVQDSYLNDHIIFEVICIFLHIIIFIVSENAQGGNEEPLQHDQVSGKFLEMKSKVDVKYGSCRDIFYLLIT